MPSSAFKKKLFRSDRKSTRLNSSHTIISYAVFCFTKYDSQQQIVISSDCPPREIPQLRERLLSRFECGLIADIQAPDLFFFKAIRKNKAQTYFLPLPVYV